MKYQITIVSNGRPKDNSHPACGTHNPPWWCSDSSPAANIDSSLFLLIAKYKFKIR